MAELTRNERFAKQKHDQIKSAADAKAAHEARIASGEITHVSGNRYRVNVGYDRGEYITVNTETFVVTAEHGLDQKEDGSVALYHRVPAWWGVGTLIPAGLSSMDAVLKAGGLDWTVGKRPVFMPTFMTDEDWQTVREEAAMGGLMAPANAMYAEVPGQFATYRTDTQEPLGIVGSRYTPAQNGEAFQFLEGLFDSGDMIAETAGSLYGGRRVFITAECPDDMVIDPNGVADRIKLFLAIMNSHDGTTPITVVMTPWRIECANTERFALRDAKTKWSFRHTRNWKEKSDQARQTLGLTRKYADAWIEEETSLLQASFTGNQIDALIREVWGEPKEGETGKAVTIHNNRRDTVHEIFGEESRKVGRNAYAAERAVTAWVDHFKTLRPSDAALKGNRLAALGAAILEESGDEAKNKAHQKLMLLTRY